ncbi:MAG: recombinase family protein [Chitinophagaceae bacterium]
MTQRKAIIYYRVSTDEQADGYSLLHQEERLRNYCELNNILVVGAYREDHSAKTFERPEFKKLLTVFKKKTGMADLLLFTKWDRFSRNAGDAYGMINQLKKMSIDPQAIEQPLNLDIPENKMMLAFYLAAPEVENDRRALNVIVGMRRGRKDGRWLGMAPKGYINTRDEQKKPIIEPNTKTAPVVQWVFEELAKGVWEAESLRKEANKKGLIVSNSQFYQLIRNKVYCGKVYICAWKEEPEQWVKGIHTPIISESLFYEVQDVLTGKKRVTVARGTSDDSLPLRGFLVCKCCGRPLTGSAAKGNGGSYYYYHCQKATKCKERFRATVAHEVFELQLAKISAKPEILDLYHAILSDIFKKNGVNKGKQVKEVSAEIEKLKLRIANAQSLMLDGEITAIEYREIKTGLFPKVEGLERKKVSLQSNDEDYQRYIDGGFAVLKNLPKAFRDADLRQKQHLIGSIFPEKLVFEEKSYRTVEANVILELIALPSKAFGIRKKELASDYAGQPYLVGKTGFEPATS